VIIIGVLFLVCEGEEFGNSPKVKGKQDLDNLIVFCGKITRSVEKRTVHSESH